MKKLLTSLAILTISTSSVTPILSTAPKTNNIQKESDIDNGNYHEYQTKETWEKYIKNNQGFISTIKDIGGIGAEYQYQGTDLNLETIKIDKDTVQPIGTLLMNGKIHTTVGSPKMVSQHIIDNFEGPNPITVNYDSKTVTSTSTISASFSMSVSASITFKQKINLLFSSTSMSATLSFSLGASLSTSSSVEEKVTFDKFSTTVKSGDKVEVDYVIMQNLQVFNMVLKAKLNLDNCKFNFINSSGTIKSIMWSTLAKDESATQIFASQISNSLSPEESKKGIQSFLSAGRIYDPNIPEERRIYDPNIVNIYLPLSFALDGYSTLITQTKL